MTWDKDLSHSNKMDILMNRRWLDPIQAAERLAAPMAFGKWDAGLTFSSKVDILSKLPGGSYEGAYLKLIKDSIKPLK